MTIYLLIAAYLLVALLLYVVWDRQGRFPEVYDCIDAVFLTIIMLLWPFTVAIVIYTLRSERP